MCSSGINHLIHQIKLYVSGLRPLVTNLVWNYSLLFQMNIFIDDKLSRLTLTSIHLCYLIFSIAPYISIYFLHFFHSHISVKLSKSENYDSTIKYINKNAKNHIKISQAIKTSNS